MIAGYIAGYPVAAMTNDVQLSGNTVEAIHRPGIHGHDWREIGVRGEPFQIQTVIDCVNSAAASAVKIAYRATRGNLISVTDPRGAVWTNLMVLDVKFLQTQTGYFVRGGVNNGNILVTAIWDLHPNALVYG